MTAFTPPTVRYAWPTGDRLIDRIQLNRGVSIITDGAGGWITNEVPFLGDIEDLVEGRDYFMGGHVYDIDDATAAALTAAGFIVGTVAPGTLPLAYPGQFYPGTTYPGEAGQTVGTSAYPGTFYPGTTYPGAA